MIGYVLTAGNQEVTSPSHLVRTHSSFSMSVMVSVAVCKLGCMVVPTSFLLSLEQKLNKQYYWDLLLIEELQTAITAYSPWLTRGQHCSRPARHCTTSSSTLLSRHPDIISSEDTQFICVGYHIEGMMHELVYRVPIRDTEELWLQLTSKVDKFISFRCQIYSWFHKRKNY